MDTCDVSEVGSRSNSLEAWQREGAGVLVDGLTNRVEPVSLAALHRQSCISGSAASRAIVNTTFREPAHTIDGDSSVHTAGVDGVDLMSDTGKKLVKHFVGFVKSIFGSIFSIFCGFLLTFLALFKFFSFQKRKLSTGGQGPHVPNSTTDVHRRQPDGAAGAL